MADPADMIMPMLRDMRAENKALHGATAERLDLIERRLKKLEDAQVSYRQALTADTLMSRLLTGEFEERIEALEKKMQELEAQK
jgi:polyhydroxyalkanoate synthesis regulator phasin